MIGAPPQTPAALESLSDFADAKSRDRAGALMGIGVKPFCFPYQRCAGHFRCSSLYQFHHLMCLLGCALACR